jgi:hypothetical protein
MTEKKRQDDMKPELKDLMQELQIAFNESVCESDRIAEILADIKRSGYDVLLALEVTIGMTTAKPSEPEPIPAQEPVAGVPGELNFTEEDRDFLQGLHIRAEA